MPPHNLIREFLSIADGVWVLYVTMAMYAGAFIWRQIHRVVLLKRGDRGAVSILKFSNSSIKSTKSKMPTTEVASPMETGPTTPSKKIRLDTETAAQPPVLRFAKLTENAFTPTRGSKLAAGYDLYR